RACIPRVGPGHANSGIGESVVAGSGAKAGIRRFARASHERGTGRERAIRHRHFPWTAYSFLGEGTSRTAVRAEKTSSAVLLPRIYAAVDSRLRISRYGGIRNQSAGRNELQDPFSRRATAGDPQNTCTSETRRKAVSPPQTVTGCVLPGTTKLDHPIMKSAVRRRSMLRLYRLHACLVRLPQLKARMG